MPIHSAANLLQGVDFSYFALCALGVGFAGFAKGKMGGRKCIWERDWAGKMIIIAAPPTPSILSLIDYLLNLPHPPQILYLAPFASPLPERLLTILHTIKISITNPLAQLHCEAMPRTPIGIRSFVERWGKVSTGMTGEGGRRIDAVILGGGWGISEEEYIDGPNATGSGRDVKEERKWTVHEYHFHLLHSLLPSLLRQPVERNIRIISLISPTLSAALPTLLGKQAKEDAAQISGAKGITTLLLNTHLQLICDTLSAVALKRVKEVPNVDGDGGMVKKREEGVESNIMVLGVVMPWTRDEIVKPWLRVDQSWWRMLLWILFYPLLIILTPSPRRAIQSIIFALQAPVRYGPLNAPSDPAATPIAPFTGSSDKADNSQERADPRRSGVGRGDVVRDCAVADMPPVLSDPRLAKATYDSIEKAVEEGVKEDAKREKAFGSG